MAFSAADAQGASTINRNGEILPVPVERTIPVVDGDKIQLGDDQTLTLMETPGHAPHELCILESLNGGIFAGDAVGHYIEGTDIMVPITPPPSFDLDLYIRSLRRMIELKPTRIYYAHSGWGDHAVENLEKAKAAFEA